MEKLLIDMQRLGACEEAFMAAMSAKNLDELAQHPGALGWAKWLCCRVEGLRSAYGLYVAVKEAAFQEYNRLHSAAYEEYYKITNAAGAEYYKTTNAAGAEYYKTTDAAYDEYNKIKNKAASSLVDAVKAYYEAR